MKFKIGDKVRINCPITSNHGRTGTVWGLDYWNVDDIGFIEQGAKLGSLCYLVNVDGKGKTVSKGIYFAYEEHELSPLTNPHQEAWEAFKTLHLVGRPELVNS